MRLLNVASAGADQPQLVMDEDIQIPANAKVAVKNVTVNYEPEKAVIPAGAVIARFNIPRSGTHRDLVWSFPQTVTDLGKILSLLYKIRFVADKALMVDPFDYSTIVPSTIGGEFLVTQDKDGRTSLSYGTGRDSDPGQVNPNLMNHNLKYQSSGKYYYADTPTLEKVYNSLTAPKSMANGFGRMRIRLAALLGGGSLLDTGFVFGASMTSQPQDVTDIKFGAYVDKNRDIFLIGDGVVRSGSQGTLEDKQGLEIFHNYNSLVLYQWGKNVDPSKVPQYIADYNDAFDPDVPSPRYYPMFSIMGYCELNNFRYTPTPLGTRVEGLEVYDDDFLDEPLLGASDAPIKRQPSSPFGVTFEWILRDLSYFLGYRDPLELTRDVDKDWIYTFRSQKRVLTPQRDLAFRLLSPDLPLAQPDGLTHTNQPILIVAANPSWLPGRLVWESDYPTFLSLKNVRPLTLRRIRFKVERLDGDPFPIEPGSIVNIVILVST